MASNVRMKPAGIVTVCEPRKWTLRIPSMRGYQIRSLNPDIVWIRFVVLLVSVADDYCRCRWNDLSITILFARGPQSSVWYWKFGDVIVFSVRGRLLIRYQGPGLNVDCVKCTGNLDFQKFPTRIALESWGVCMDGKSNSWVALRVRMSFKN